MTLTPGDGAVGDDRIKTLAGLRAFIPPAEASLDALRLSAATLARQKQIVAASLTFLDDVVGRRKFARSSLLAFTRGIGSARHGECHRGPPHAVGCHPRRGLGFTPRT